MLKGINVDFDYLPEITRSEIKYLLPKYDGLIIRSKTKVDRDLIKNAKLKFVARAGAGIDNLDTSVLAKHGVAIINAPEGNRDAVGEHTIGLILNLLHNLTKSHNQITENNWDREGNRGWELASLTVGIFGYGNTGTAVAKKLSGFGCNVIAYDKYLEVNPGNDVEMVDLDTFFKRTNILSLHIPLTEETDGLVNIGFLNKFYHNLIFMNTSRGEIAPLNELKKAIKTRKIRMAGLDVLENENIPSMNEQQYADFCWLKESGKVLFTPHVAGWTMESYQRINEVLVDKIAAFVENTRN